MFKHYFAGMTHPKQNKLLLESKNNSGEPPLKTKRILAGMKMHTNNDGEPNPKTKIYF